jgi:flagellar motility protein MotE (MotC chaperone)
MEKQSVATSLAPHVLVDQIGGCLQVKGWERPEVTVYAQPEDLTLEENDDIATITCRGDAEVRVPHGASLQVKTVSGSAYFKLLEDDLDIGQVEGNLGLRAIAAARVESVHGHLEAKEISGDLQVGAVHGHASIKEVQGNCLLEQVDGHLELRDVEGNIRVRTNGNARLRLSTLAGDSYTIQAQGEIYCRIPEDASLKLDLSSKANLIKVRLPNRSQTYQQSQYELIVGSGMASMQLSAGGELYLMAEEIGWSSEEEPAEAAVAGFSRLPEDYSQQIASQVQSQIQSQMEAMTRQLNEQLAHLSAWIGNANLPPDESRRIMEQARQTSEREAARVQEKMRRAQEKLERRLEASRQREEMRLQAAERHLQSRSRHNSAWERPAPPSPAAPPEPVVSDEERLAVLRMLAQKKITPDEADQLLTALEGKRL